jgi:hypothetical protein
MSERRTVTPQQGREANAVQESAGKRKPFVSPRIEDLGGLTQLTQLGGTL